MTDIERSLRKASEDDDEQGRRFRTRAAQLQKKKVGAREDHRYEDNGMSPDRSSAHLRPAHAAKARPSGSVAGQRCGSGKDAARHAAPRRPQPPAEQHYLGEGPRSGPGTDPFSSRDQLTKAVRR